MADIASKEWVATIRATHPQTMVEDDFYVQVDYLRPVTVEQIKTSARSRMAAQLDVHKALNPKWETFSVSPGSISKVKHRHV